MDEKDYYFFYCIKDGKSTLCNETIYKDVIKITSNDKKEARKKAKEIMFERHPNVPRSFRKNKDKYFYMCDSNKFYYIEINDFECKFCGKKQDYKGMNSTHIENGFCSYECMVRYNKIKKDLYENELSKYLDEDVENKNNYISYYSSQRIGYIYLITNKIKNKVYVGQTTQEPLFRWWQHLKDEKKFEIKDLTDLKFEVLEKIDIGENNYTKLKQILFEKEDYYIELYNSLEPNGYNKINAKQRKEKIEKQINQLSLF